jgi:hypothetical protein
MYSYIRPRPNQSINQPTNQCKSNEPSTMQRMFVSDISRPSLDESRLNSGDESQVFVDEVGLNYIMTSGGLTIGQAIRFSIQLQSHNTDESVVHGTIKEHDYPGITIEGQDISPPLNQMGIQVSVFTNPTSSRPHQRAYSVHVQCQQLIDSCERVQRNEGERAVPERGNEGKEEKTGKPYRIKSSKLSITNPAFVRKVQRVHLSPSRLIVNVFNRIS